jgi:metal-responsive CopG/Arc/MetJ family transcriptional regulator
MSTLNGPKKKMGRPPVDSEAVKVRLERKLLNRIDQWRDNAPGRPNRPEAIRRLVEKGLSDE